MSRKTIGFVGLGTMGLPMAKNLLDAGYRVVGHDRADDRVETLRDRGGDEAGSPAAVADRTDVVLLCLPDSPHVENAVLGTGDERDPLVEGLSEGATVVDHSTISPTVTEALAERMTDEGVAWLDAPVSGGESGAVEGRLSVMVGGDGETLDAQRDLLQVVGETVTHCGPVGAGQTTKACNQLVVAAQMVAVSEALVLADRAGADPDAVVAALGGGAAGCWVLDNRARSMLRGEFDPGFFAEYHYKDLRIATEAAGAYGVSLSLTSVAHDLYGTMVENGMGRDDNSGVIQVVEMLSGEETGAGD